MSKTLLEVTLDKRTIAAYIYTFNSINNFMTFRYMHKALGVLEPFKEFLLSLNLVSLMLVEKYLRTFVSDKRLI
jgi:hypothetical protein